MIMDRNGRICEPESGFGYRGQRGLALVVNGAGFVNHSAPHPIPWASRLVMLLVTFLR